MAHEPTLVIGGTRGTGRLIVERLVARGQPVRVLARNPARGGAPRAGGLVQVVEGDITRSETLPAAVAGARNIMHMAGFGERRRRGRERRPLEADVARVRRADFSG